MGNGRCLLPHLSLNKTLSLPLPFLPKDTGNFSLIYPTDTRNSGTNTLFLPSASECMRVFMCACIYIRECTAVRSVCASYFSTPQWMSVSYSFSVTHITHAPSRSLSVAACLPTSSKFLPLWPLSSPPFLLPPPLLCIVVPCMPSQISLN